MPTEYSVRVDAMRQCQDTYGKLFAIDWLVANDAPIYVGRYVGRCLNCQTKRRRKHRFSIYSAPEPYPKRRSAPSDHAKQP